MKPSTRTGPRVTTRAPKPTRMGTKPPQPAGAARSRLRAQVAGTMPGLPRQHAQALLEAGRASRAGIEAVLRRHVGILRDSLAELHSVGRLMRQVGVRESVAHLDQLLKGAVELTQVSVGELAALAVATQRQAIQILAARLHGDLAAFRRMRSGQDPTPAP